MPARRFPPNLLGVATVQLDLSAFAPYIAKADRYLAGWQASLLKPMGRSVLVNTVLDGQLSYITSALSLLSGVIAQFDKRQRGFL